VPTYVPRRLLDEAAGTEFMASVMPTLEDVSRRAAEVRDSIGSTMQGAASGTSALRAVTGGFGIESLPSMDDLLGMAGVSAPSTPAPAPASPMPSATVGFEPTGAASSGARPVPSSPVDGVSLRPDSATSQAGPSSVSGFGIASIPSIGELLDMVGIKPPAPPPSPAPTRAGPGRHAHGEPDRDRRAAGR
jgi:hypothetical protein